MGRTATVCARRLPSPPARRGHRRTAPGLCRHALPVPRAVRADRWRRGRRIARGQRNRLTARPKAGDAVWVFSNERGVTMAYTIGIVLGLFVLVFARMVGFDRDRAF